MLVVLAIRLLFRSRDQSQVHCRTELPVVAPVVAPVVEPVVEPVVASVVEPVVALVVEPVLVLGRERENQQVGGLQTLECCISIGSACRAISSSGYG